MGDQLLYFSYPSQQSHHTWRCSSVRGDGLFKISKYLIQNSLLFSPYSPLRKIIINSEPKGLEMYWYFKVPQIGMAQDPLAFELSPRVSAETPTVGMQRNGWLAENFSSSE